MLTTTLVIGLLGALLMFCGDMTLYFDKNDYEQNGTLDGGRRSCEGVFFSILGWKNGAEYAILIQ